MTRAAFEQFPVHFALSACLWGLVSLSACTSDSGSDDSDSQGEEEVVEEQNYLELGWIGNWSSEFEGTHTFYSRDVLNDEYVCLFSWKTAPILDEDGLAELNNSCGDDGVSACDFEFAQEIEYTEGSLLSDPLTGELSDCKTFSLSEGSSLGETRKYAFEANSVDDYSQSVLMQYYEATESQAAGWQELAKANYDEGLDEISYSRAYAYFKLSD